MNVADVGVKEPVGPVYLGDGVYASFDGFHINLTLGNHQNRTLVAMEPAVIAALLRYLKYVKEKTK